MSEDYPDSTTTVTGAPVEDDSFPWGKTILFLFVGVIVVGVAAYLIYRFCIKDKLNKNARKSTKSEKDSEESSQKAKTNSSRSVRKPPPKKMTAAQKKAEASRRQRKSQKSVQMTPTIVMKPVDETTPPHSPPSFVPPSIIPLSTAITETHPDSSMAKTPTKTTTAESTDEETNKEKVLVMCNYGNEWMVKTKAPADFSFSIESD